MNKMNKKEAFRMDDLSSNVQLASTLKLHPRALIVATKNPRQRKKERKKGDPNEDDKRTAVPLYG